MKIAYVDRYGTYTGDYVYYVHYKNGDIEQYAQANMPKDVFIEMAKLDFQFMRNMRGEMFHRFKPYSK